MINAIVVGLHAHMGIVLYSSKRAEVEIECVVDTGFEGFLTLPPAVVVDLGLPYVAPIDANLVDNSRVVTNVHQGIILWHGVERVIPILAISCWGQPSYTNPCPGMQ